MKHEGEKALFFIKLEMLDNRVYQSYMILFRKCSKSRSTVLLSLFLSQKFALGEIYVGSNNGKSDVVNTS